MKRLILICFAGLCLAACNSNEPTPAMPDETTQVEIDFGGSTAETRGFFEDQAVNQTWESAIKSAKLYIYNAQGNFVTSHTLSSQEIAARKLSIALPLQVLGTYCTFYLAANGAPTESSTESAFLNVTSLCGGSSYHVASAAGAISGPVVSSGFGMTGSSRVLVNPAGQRTLVSITLVREVAKIAFRAKAADDFSSRNNGATITVNTVTLTNSADKCYAFERSGYISTTYSSRAQTSQRSGSYYQNLFYALENGTSRPTTIILDCTFDRDGNTATTADRTPVQFEVQAAPGTGTLARNTYYQIDAVINGTGGLNLDLDLELTFTVKNWTVTSLQNITFD